MFSNLTEHLNTALKKIQGQGRITEKNIKDTITEISNTLIDADVALEVLNEIIAKIQQQALGEKVLSSLTPGQVMTKIVHDELVAIMGDANETLNLDASPPVVILMAGLQGSGKTTSVAKLARWLKSQKKRVMVTSTDIYRPAAIIQLQRLAQTLDIAHFPSNSEQDPVDIINAAKRRAGIEFMDVLIIDTAGRTHIDEKMMAEIQMLHQISQPTETLFVVDSMTGQDAAKAAKTFHDALPLTGVILTKADGDARGGAALSIRYLTGKPIKFIGVGEKMDALEPFHPDRMVSRILGMGDILSLVEEAEQKIDKKQAEKMAEKLKKGRGFDFEDYLVQLQQMKNMGGMAKLMEKLPMAGQMPKALKQHMNDDIFKESEALIQSMTRKERRFPALIKGSRKERIAKGSGNTIAAVNRLLKQFDQMQKMTKKMAKGGMTKMMRQMQNMQNRMPPGRF
jgi:signal recognition particle subunit SRP54